MPRPSGGDGIIKSSRHVELKPSYDPEIRVNVNRISVRYLQLVLCSESKSLQMSLKRKRAEKWDGDSSAKKLVRLALALMPPIDRKQTVRTSNIRNEKGARRAVALTNLPEVALSTALLAEDTA